MAKRRPSRNRRYEVNPFFDDQKDLLSDIEEILADYEDQDGDSMSDYVRVLNPRSGLDKVSRRRGNSYGNMARRPYMSTSSPSTLGQFGDDAIPDDPDRNFDNLRYSDPNYYRNEFNQSDDEYDDLGDIDTDADFLYSLMQPDEEDFDDELDNVFDQGVDDDFDNYFDLDDEEGEFEEGEDDLDGDPDDELDMGEEDEEDFDDDLDDDLDESDVPQYDGIVRSVKGAYLVSRKQQPDQTFTEVWIYNTDRKYENEANTRKAILAGTDIDPKTSVSEDKSQKAIYKSIGNVQFLTIVGLPN